MQFSDLDPAYRGFVSDMLVRAGFDPQRFPLDIAPDDEMFVRGVLPGYPGRPGAAYFRFIQSAVRTHLVYRQLVDHLGGFGALPRVLDFGSGHGRLTRTLIGHLRPEQIWACDIYPHAVAWQAETFGVNGLVSVSRPDRFALTGEFAIIFAGSVFSHLPDPLFRAWLARLYALTAPGGALAITVHGEAFAPEGQTIGPDGIGFAAWSESLTLDPQIYGMSYVTEAYVREAVAGACGPAAAEGLARFPRALFESQDVYVIPGPGTDLAGLQLRAPPLTSFRKVGSDSGRWVGWGLEPNPGRQIVSADLWIDERHVATCAPREGAADILRFFPGAPNPPVEWAFDTGPLPAGAKLRVELRADTGLCAQAYLQTLPEGDAARA